MCSGDDPVKLTLGVNTDMTGVAIKGKDYTDDLAELITRTAGEVRAANTGTVELLNYH